MQTNYLKNLIRQALHEDAVAQDLTTHLLVPKQAKAKAVLLAKQDLVVCGLGVVEQVFKTLHPKIKISTKVPEGQWVKKGQVIARLQGNARVLLSGERLALNFLQRLSGIATFTRRFVEAMKGTGVEILDTRKTTPNIRELERYAVRTGGGTNHRFDLKSALMVKDNHLLWAKSFSQLAKTLRPYFAKKRVILEVKTLPQLREALELGFPWIQLDNMTVAQLRRAVFLAKGRALLEATGGVHLHNARQIARTGVDFISIGAITHSAPAVDISLEMEKFP